MTDTANLGALLAKMTPIRVHDGPDYAEVFFGNGVAHNTQAMTMNPQDWRDLSDALKNAVEPMLNEIERLREALGRIARLEGVGGPDAQLQCADMALAALAQETQP